MKRQSKHGPLRFNGPHPPNRRRNTGEAVRHHHGHPAERARTDAGKPLDDTPAPLRERGPGKTVKCSRRPQYTVNDLDPVRRCYADIGITPRNGAIS